MLPWDHGGTHVSIYATPRHATPRHATPRHATLVLLLLLGCESVDVRDVSYQPQALERRDSDFYQSGGETVYLNEWITGSDGEVISSSVDGSISLDSWAAAARPSAAAARRMGSFFNEGGWEILDSEGMTHSGYVMTRENYSGLPTPTLEEKEISSRVVGWIQKGAPSDSKPLVVRFAGFAEWDIPLMPTVDVLSPHDVALGIQLRQVAIENRKSRLRVIAREVAQRIGVSEYIEMWVTGEIFVISTPAIAGVLMNLSEVVRIEIDEAVSPNTCSSDATCSGVNAFSPLSQWRLGQGRRGNRTNVDSFLSQGWTGERANPGRHVW